MIKLIDGWNKEDNIIGTVEDVASYLNIEDRVKNIYDLENELSSSEYESRYSIVPLKFEVVETYKDSDEEFVHGRFEKLEEAQKEADCLTTEDYQKILEEYNGRLSSLPEFI